MVDRYTKTILTVIAAALVALVIQGLAPKAIAQYGMSACGDSRKPCYIELSTVPLPVELVK